MISELLDLDQRARVIRFSSADSGSPVLTWINMERQQNDQHGLGLRWRSWGKGVAEILVAITNTDADRQALAFAAQLARKQPSSLLTVVQPIELSAHGRSPSELAGASSFAMAPEPFGHASKRARWLKRGLLALEVPHVHEFEDGRTDLPHVAIARRARAFDFAVVACGASTRTELSSQHTMFKALLKGGGRPIFAVPAQCPVGLKISRVLIGWAPTLGSIRAAHALLELAPGYQIDVVSVCNGADAEDSGQRLVEVWSRKGANVSFSLIPRKAGSIGVILLRRAAEIDANLIVCGAYGHSATRESLIGGITRSLLRNTPVPVLFSG